MRQRFIRIKEVFFAVRLRMVWLVPVFVYLCWIPCFHFPLKAAKAAELSRHQNQKQTTSKNSRIRPTDLSVKDTAEQPLVVYDGPGGRLLKYKLRADILETLKPDIDIFQNTASGYDETFFSSNLYAHDSDNRFEIFRLEQNLKDFKFGLEYRYVAKHLNYFSRYKNKTETKTKVGLKNDQEGVEIWGEKKIGAIGFKTFFSRFLNNVGRDPVVPRMLTHKYGIEMNYRMESLPIGLFFSHYEENSENDAGAGGIGYEGHQKETFNGSLKYYGGKRFDITASSSYSFSRDLLHPGQTTVSIRNKIRSSIRPAPRLTITPVLSIGEYRYLWYGDHEIHPSASLFLMYRRIFKAINLALHGRYSQTKNTDQTLDNERLTTSIGLTWNEKSVISRKIGYFLSLGYNHYLDNIQPDSSYSALYASFKLELAL